MIKADPSLRGPEVVEKLEKKFPKITFNNASCQVAFANARKKLGLTKTVVPKPSSAPAPAPAVAVTNIPSTSVPSSSSSAGEYRVLHAAKELMQTCGGDTEMAIKALKALKALQMS